MKIEELEKVIIRDGLSPEIFDEYKKSLKRVKSNFLKRQHCYTTAIQFSGSRFEQAIQLIKYGLENYPDTWFSTYTSYLHIGNILESSGKYSEAFTAFLSAKDALSNDKPEYLYFISGKLMWMKLHIDGFNYSEEFEEYYNAFSNINDFSKGIINNEFMLSVGKTVISIKNNDTEKAKESLKNALSLCNPGVIGRLQQIFDKHKYTDKLNATPESIAFVKSFSF